MYVPQLDPENPLKDRRLQCIYTIYVSGKEISKSEMYISLINCWKDTGKDYILLNRLNVHLHLAGLLPESQFGFRKDIGITYVLFTARHLQEKCQKQNVGLFVTFIDLTKAFDTVCRFGL